MKDNQDIFEEVEFEILRQIKLEHGGDTIEFDKQNSEADWAAFISYYASRSVPRLYKAYEDSESPTSFRNDMVKVAALAISAIKAFDRSMNEITSKVFADTKNF